MIGGPALSTQQKHEPNGAPIALGALNNGLSVDPLTAKGVLGNASGEPGNPGQFLSPREIETNGHSLILFGSVNNPGIIPYWSVLNGYMDCGIDGNLISAPIFGLRYTDQNNLGPLTGKMNLGIYPMAGLGTCGGIGCDVTFMKFDDSTGQVWVTQTVGDAPPGVGSFNVIGSIAAIGVQGNIFGKRNVIQGVGTPEIFDPNFSRSIYSNEALAALNVDISAGTLGGEVSGVVVQAGSVSLTPGAGDTITIGAVTGAAGAPAVSIVPGSVIKLIKITAGWYAESVVGAWTV